MQEINGLYKTKQHSGHDYRDMIFANLPRLDREQPLQDQLESMLAQEMQQAKEGQRYPGPNMAIFICAIGLLAFGKLEMASIILATVPKVRNMEGLSSIILALIPIPPNLRPLHHPDEILEWLQNHENHLEWREAEARFVFVE